MSKKTKIRDVVKGDNWNDVENFLDCFDPKELELVLQVISDEMELASVAENNERYEMLDNYYGAVQGKIEERDRKEEYEEQRFRRGAYYDTLQDTRPSWW